MKKVFTLLAIAAAFTFTACNEAHEETTTEETVVEETVVEEEVVTEEEAPVMEADTTTVMDEAVEAVEEGAEEVMDAVDEMAH